MKGHNVETLLKQTTLKATKGRQAVLTFLLHQKHPVGVDVICAHVKGVNKVTLYRMMQDFEACGLVTSYTLGHGHIDYEIANRPHHHHLVCQGCGDIEDVYSCTNRCKMETLVMKKSKKFSTIQKQATTFFGTCHRCTG